MNDDVFMPENDVLEGSAIAIWRCRTQGKFIDNLFPWLVAYSLSGMAICRVSGIDKSMCITSVRRLPVAVCRL